MQTEYSHPTSSAPNYLSVRALSRHLMNRNKNLESLFDELSYILSLPSYSQRSLCQLLDVLKRHPLVDTQFVSKLVDKYVDSRGSIDGLEPNTISKLVLSYAHVGDMDAAESLVVLHQDPLSMTTCESSALYDFKHGRSQSLFTN